MSNQFAMSFPALNGDVVMQGHADYCAKHGHATHTVRTEDGAVTIAARCPRCGDLLEAPSNPAEDLAKVTGANKATYATERRNADGTLTVESVETYSRAAAHDMRAAWQFILDSYDGGYSVIRADWTDAEILAFVAEYHVDGPDAFKLP